MRAYERVQQGETLWDDPDFLRVILQNTSEGLLTIDAESRIVFATPAIEGVLGYEPDELVGSSKMKIIPERLRPVHEESFRRYRETGERNIDWDGFDLPALHKEGHEVPVSVSLREHEYRGEQLFTGIFRDITERKAREERLRTQNDELEEFAGVLSHDLRNPLSVAQGFTEMAREEGDNEEHLGRVSTALDRMEEIIEDMLARSREAETVGSVARVSLETVVEDAWESVFAPDATLVAPEQHLELVVNRGRVQQLAENLFRNAIEHGGETVTVRVGVLDDGDGFFIEDDGPGLPMHLRDRTWLPEGGDERRYGLDIVETIADEHDWELYLTASKSGGARFEFRGVTQ
jgi:PAS domain S-box-containing protein